MSITVTSPLARQAAVEYLGRCSAMTPNAAGAALRTAEVIGRVPLAGRVTVKAELAGAVDEDGNGDWRYRIAQVVEPKSVAVVA